MGQLVRTRRLVTLAGPPGIGKTRLAVAVAETVAGSFDGGVVFVSLAETGEPERAAAAIARALGVPDVPGEEVAETIVRHLGEVRLLLVLDNFEHLLAEVPLVRSLLRAPRLVVLATSRERLLLSGEQVYSVPPLTLPALYSLPPGEAGVELALAGSSALALFVLHAQGADPGFVLDQANLAAVAELCWRLDGLPLAIEIAAARVGAFTPDHLVADLAHSLTLCSAGPRDLPVRQQTLYRAIEWSYALLDPGPQLLLARLSVFPGGCLVEAARAVCAPEGAADDHNRLNSQLATLVDKHLLRAQAEAGGRTRYVMLETIRGFAVGKLAANEEEDAVRARHAMYYAAFATQAGQQLTGPDQAAWRGRIEREYHNLQAALAWALGNGHIETAGITSVGLDRYWLGSRSTGEGRRWYERVLAAPHSFPARLHAQVLLSAGQLACWQDDYGPARVLAERALVEARRVDDAATMAEALNLLGVVAMIGGDYELAGTH